ncbi:hypothetical protein AVEN_250264-1 [Araneus ventricosus]|uniref:Uncharacterized protein n=1 Tax=Araneus ventricosus TaxID=182803 RepID=A0A4Y2X5N6_ARAVE|nr:hypothetical protein AVEN_250264-1 [Araneus ventricosus]
MGRLFSDRMPPHAPVTVTITVTESVWWTRDDFLVTSDHHTKRMKFHMGDIFTERHPLFPTYSIHSKHYPVPEENDRLFSLQLPLRLEAGVDYVPPDTQFQRAWMNGKSKKSQSIKTQTRRSELL